MREEIFFTREEVIDALFIYLERAQIENEIKEIFEYTESDNYYLKIVIKKKDDN